jgi:hypothetical protein
MQFCLHASNYSIPLVGHFDVIPDKVYVDRTCTGANCGQKWVTKYYNYQCVRFASLIMRSRLKHLNGGRRHKQILPGTIVILYSFWQNGHYRMFLGWVS